VTLTTPTNYGNRNIHYHPLQCVRLIDAICQQEELISEILTVCSFSLLRPVIFMSLLDASKALSKVVLRVHLFIYIKMLFVNK